MQVVDKLQTVVDIQNRAAFDPVWFAKEVLGIDGEFWKLDPWQVELLEAVADVWRFKNGVKTKFNHEGKNKITVRAMHGPGKTFGVALVAHWFGFCFKSQIPCTAPKERQLLTRLWPAFRKIYNRAEEWYKFLLKVDNTKVTWCNDPDWFMIAETASSPDNLAGYHDDFLLFICEEASGIKEEMFPVIEGAISTGRMVIILMIGNPTNNVGTFYQSHKVKKVAKDYYRLHVSLAKTTRVSKAWVQQQKAKYGSNSPIVKVRCLGEFADSGQNQLYAMQWIEDALNGDCSPDGSIPSVRVSVDVSDGGEDESVVTAALIYQSKVVVKRMAMHSFEAAISTIETGKAAARVYDSLLEATKAVYGPTVTGDVVVDSIGVGAGTAGYLINEGYSVILYKGGASSDDPKQWANRRSQSYLVSRNYHRDGKIVYEEGFIDEDRLDDFHGQMASIKTQPGKEKFEEIEPKQRLIDKGIKSPDMPDSGAQLFTTEQPIIASTLEAEAILESGVEEYADWHV